MLYRVLCLVFLCATSSHAAAIVPPTGPVSLPGDEVPLAELLYGFRYTSEDVPHPMNDARGNLMWDASGTGCVDGGGWDEPFPSVKGDLREPVFCIPQPCAGLLTPEELSREVYGRPLEEGEYETYLDRLEETCEQMPGPAVDTAALDFAEFLSFASYELVQWSPEDDLAGFVPAAAPGSFLPLQPRGYVPYGGALTPVDLRADFPRLSLLSPPARTVYPSFSRAGGGPAPRGAYATPRVPHFGGGGGRGGSSPKAGKPKPPLVSQFTPRKPEGPTTRPGGPTVPGPKSPQDPYDPGDPGQSQPAPVPLAGGMPLLLTALGALAVRRLPGQRRRSRRELMG